MRFSDAYVKDVCLNMLITNRLVFKESTDAKNLCKYLLELAVFPSANVCALNDPAFLLDIGYSYIVKREKAYTGCTEVLQIYW